uniref:very-long-chain (3R)-3-hydroxyacyl-CoA dehydratase n=1 Tax=Syphacia muris TaxID=451379 RepID=A0A0N5AIV8_9BILA
MSNFSVDELRSVTKGILKYYLVGYNIFMFLIHFYVLTYLLGCYILYGTGRNYEKLIDWYPYYTVSCLGTEYKVTTWFRYNMWIPLYPSGFLLEGILFVFISCILLVFGTYLLYYMFRQRRRKFVTLQKKIL